MDDKNEVEHDANNSVINIVHGTIVERIAIIVLLENPATFYSLFPILCKHAKSDGTN